MADYYRTDNAPAVATSGVRRLTNLAGAGVSLALIVGVGIWGTELVMRDVSGVPVVRAAEGPMRIAPENPGGRPADHQGLAVNDVAGSGTAAAPADTLRLAPQSAGLTEEDMAVAELRQQTQQIERIQPAAAPTEEAVDSTLPSMMELTGADDAEKLLQALADQIAGDAQPFTPLAKIEEEADPVVTAALAANNVVEEPAAQPVKAIIPADVAGVAKSLRPIRRPQGLQTASLSAPSAPVATGRKELDPAALPKGTRLVQLGAFDSVEVARSEWTRLQGRFGDYLEGKDRVIEKASSGGKIFYRLRAHGFDDMSDARRFCAAFVAGKADCIPVVTR